MRSSFASGSARGNAKDIDYPPKRNGNMRPAGMMAVNIHGGITSAGGLSRTSRIRTRSSPGAITKLTTAFLKALRSVPFREELAPSAWKTWPATCGSGASTTTKYTGDRPERIHAVLRPGRNGCIAEEAGNRALGACEQRRGTQTFRPIPVTISAFALPANATERCPANTARRPRQGAELI
jgi:hypothetical protein